MSPTPPELYAILGLAPQSTQAQISRAYRGLLRRHHPDTRTLGNPAQAAAADAALQQVLDAYAVLGDPGRRTHYDQHAAARQPGPAYPRQDTAQHASTRSTQPPIRVGPVRWHR